jgi:hypothetical protein
LEKRLGVDTCMPKDPPSCGWSFSPEDLDDPSPAAHRSATAIPQTKLAAMISKAMSSADATIIAPVNRSPRAADGGC